MLAAVTSYKMTRLAPLLLQSPQRSLPSQSCCCRTPRVIEAALVGRHEQVLLCIIPQDAPRSAAGVRLGEDVVGYIPQKFCGSGNVLKKHVEVPQRTVKRNTLLTFRVPPLVLVLESHRSLYWGAAWLRLCWRCSTSLAEPAVRPRRPDDATISPRGSLRLLCNMHRPDLGRIWGSSLLGPLPEVERGDARERPDVVVRNSAPKWTLKARI